MHSYILRRILLMVPVLFGVTVIVFLVISLIPGDPAKAILGTFATPENVAKVNHDLGLDRPLPVQYVIWLGNLLHGDFGRSYILHRPVIDEVLDRLFPTLLLAGAALLLSSAVGLLLGIIAAIKQNAWQDKLITVGVLVGISTPSFWLGILLIFWFAVRFSVLPVGGMVEMFGGGGIVDIARHLVLPSIALAAVAGAVLVRLTRGSMLEVMRQDYVRTARAKGLGETSVIFKHAFRNALVSVIPIIGLEAGFVLGGAVYIETVFQWPGIGRMLVSAISTRDILLVQGGVLVVAAAYVVINLMTDIAQSLLDPRMRRS
ncbi:peptide/nickel transport system permease protein [Rhizobiales bacterium GAS113]|nr:peptide/nickel transport system permease protein [Rhizobiales bacterium GAS113]SEC38724.1 peptide/nickel transport system permease protein [Rhizobiales bacterium GAS188]